jgi:hypothetical protein
MAIGTRLLTVEEIMALPRPTMTGFGQPVTVTELLPSR